MGCLSCERQERVEGGKEGPENSCGSGDESVPLSSDCVLPLTASYLEGRGE